MKLNIFSLRGILAPPSAGTKLTPLNIQGLKFKVHHLADLRFWTDVLQLSKPTIALLVVVTAVPGMLCATDAAPSLRQVIGTLIAVWFSAASAGIYNQVLEFRIDQNMQRTQRRPLAAGRVSLRTAMVIASLMLVLSSVMFLSFSNLLALSISYLANAFYVFFYTLYLKPRTVQNIVIGGAAGSVGPLIGWAAVANNIAWPAVVMFLIIFLWTPPHFWALALKYRADYARAGIPMLPVVRGDEVTRRAIFLYSLWLLPLNYFLYLSGVAGVFYLFFSFLLTAYFVWYCLQLYVDRNNQKAMKVFHISCWYLLGIFGLLSIERLFLV